MNKKKILLITMPFGPHYSPSLGLSILKAGLAGKDVTCKIKYYNLKFAETIGVDLYSQIALGLPLNQDMLGEWIFSGSLFASKAPKEKEQYIHEVILGERKEHSKNFVRRIHKGSDLAGKLDTILQEVEPFLEFCLKDIKEENPDIVGFTSIFQQQVASLSLAKRIKEFNNRIVTVFGGANNEAAMGREVIRKFDFVDIIVSGEGEKIFPALIDRLIAGETVNDLRGVFTRENLATQHFNSTELIREMDAVPYPDFDDYFEALDQYKFKSSVKPRLMYETSRGCWWGEISHCTFCGLNGEGMKFRSKSAPRALNELKYLSSKYPSYPISVVDNILDMEYFKTFIPILIEEKLDLELFYEVKANLKKEQLVLLKEAGINVIQPGIESLSDHVLKLMGKGVKAIQNIQLLKWCKEFGILPEWNMIWGFPGETEEDYQQMAELIPSLTHLHPPFSASQLRLDRFSPNFNDYKKLGFSKIYPYPSYKFIYPFDDDSVANLAYYFAFEYENPLREDYTSEFKKQIGHWQELYEESDLFYVPKGDMILVWDFRPGVTNNLTVLKDLEAFLFRSLDKMKTLKELEELCLETKVFKGATLDFIERILIKLVDKRFLFSNGVHFINLAIELGNYQPNSRIIRKLKVYLAENSEKDKKSGSDVTVVDLKKLE